MKSTLIPIGVAVVGMLGGTAATGAEPQPVSNKASIVGQ